MKHKHHIIPKHMGGTNDPSNLIELTIEEHAEAHRVLYEQYGNEKDRIAWLGLSGIVPKQETIKELYKLGRKNADQALFEKYGPEWQKIISKKGNDAVKEKYPNLHKEVAKRGHEEGWLDWSGKKHKPESIEKMKSAKVGKYNGEKNPSYGTCWITNGQENKKIKKEDLDKFIELGYYKGRICGCSSMVERSVANA